MAVVPEGEWSLHHNGWIPIDELINSALNFNMSNMLGYFLHRKAVDGCPNNDFKTVNRKAYPLFKDGHVQGVVYRRLKDMILIRARCNAEMKKAKVYTPYELCVIRIAT